MWGNSHQAQDLHQISVEFQLACIHSLCLFLECLEEHRQELDVCSSTPLCPVQIHLCRKPLAYECIWVRKELAAGVGLGKMQLLGSDEQGFLWSNGMIQVSLRPSVIDWPFQSCELHNSARMWSVGWELSWHSLWLYLPRWCWGGASSTENCWD